MPIVFVDIETTGLNPKLHEIWEVALFLPDHVTPFRVFQRKPSLEWAEPEALRVNGFYERRALAKTTHSGADVPTELVEDETLARALASALAGASMVGIGPWFDAAFLDVFLRQNGQAPAWDHGLVCSKLLAVGRLQREGSELVEPPFSTQAVVDALGVPRGASHTALADVILAARFYEYAMGGTWKFDGLVQP